MKSEIGKNVQRRIKGYKSRVKERNIPKELKDMSQWVAWKAVREDGKRYKIPIDPTTGQNASTKDKTTWGTFKEALECYRKNKLNGVGVVFTPSDPLVGIDLDHCRDPETKAIQRWAGEYIFGINSYAEISPSATGVKIFAEGKLPGGGKKKGNIEMYDQGRFFTVTGEHLEGTPMEVMRKPDIIRKIYNETFMGLRENSPKNTIHFYKVLFL